MSKSPPFTVHAIDPASEFVSVTYHTSSTDRGDRINNIFGLTVSDWSDPKAVLEALRAYGQTHYGKQRSPNSRLTSIVGKRHDGG